MDEQLIDTLAYGNLKADVYSKGLPGEFKITYRNESGQTLEELPLTGISSYKQRESEIIERMKELSRGGDIPKGDLGDAGEY